AWIDIIQLCPFVNPSLTKTHSDNDFHYSKPSDVYTSQEREITPRTRGTVTICLYLSPSCRARSLSTLIAVRLERDIPQSTALLACRIPSVILQIRIRFVITETKKIPKQG
ncbi:unnamed protein product, partial [Pocillopora meandrina]